MPVVCRRYMSFPCRLPVNMETSSNQTVITSLQKVQRALLSVGLAACALLVVSTMLASYAPTYNPVLMFARTKISDDADKARDLRESTASADTMGIGISRLKDSQGQSSHNIPQNINRSESALSEKEVAERFEKRRQILQAACRRYGNSSEFRPRELRIIPKFRYPPVVNVTVGYCPIEKTSSTTWKGIFSSIRRKMKGRNVTAVKIEVPASQRDVLFAFVREPYGRLISAYVDKIFSPNSRFWEKTGRYVVRKVRQNASTHSLTCGHDVTFPEFIKYFIHMQRTGEERNGHYIPTHDQCQMCNFPYKYIGHLETIKEDMPFILKHIQSPVSYQKAFDRNTIERNSKLALSTLRTGITECVSLGEASRRLWKKWQIRGVIHRSQNFPLTNKDTEDISDAKLSQVAIEALSRSGPRSERVGQKKEAMREAFASVPLEDRLQVQRLLFLDFQMFGFDPQPDEVFPEKPFKPDGNFSYFKLV